MQFISYDPTETTNRREVMLIYILQAMGIVVTLYLVIAGAVWTIHKLIRENQK